MRLFGLVVAALVFAPLVIGRAEGKEEPQLEDRQKKQLLHADLVVLGTIEKLGPKPRFRSGVIKARQVVVYRIDRVLAGRCSLKRIAIHHLVAGGPTAHPDPKQTGLHPEVFKPGRKVIVGATVEKSPEGFSYLFVSDDERVAPLAVSKRAKVERLLAQARQERREERPAGHNHK